MLDTSPRQGVFETGLWQEIFDNYLAKGCSIKLGSNTIMLIKPISECFLHVSEAAHQGWPNISGGPEKWKRILIMAE